MITITIKTDNAAFGDNEWTRGGEVAHILQTLAEKLMHNGLPEDLQLYDSNGNTVGTVTLTGKDRGL